MLPTQYLRVKETVRLLTPNALKAGLPMSAASNQTVLLGRDAIGRVLRQEDARFLVVGRADERPEPVHAAEGT